MHLQLSILLYCCLSFCYFIMSQETVTMTAASQMMCSSISSVTTPAMMALLELTSSFGSARCGSATTADAMGHNQYCWPCHCAMATASVPDTFSGIYQLCHESSAGKLGLPLIFSVCWCLFWCLLSIPRFIVDTIFTYGGSTGEDCITRALQSMSMAGICTSW